MLPSDCHITIIKYHHWRTLIVTRPQMRMRTACGERGRKEVLVACGHARFIIINEEGTMQPFLCALYGHAQLSEGSILGLCILFVLLSTFYSSEPQKSFTTSPMFAKTWLDLAMTKPENEQKKRSPILRITPKAPLELSGRFLTQSKNGCEIRRRVSTSLDLSCPWWKAGGRQECWYGQHYFPNYIYDSIYNSRWL